LYSTLLNTFIERDQAQMKTDSNGSIYFVHPYQSEIPKHDVERKQKRNEDGSLKFSSTWKKSFIYIPVQENHIPQLDLFFVSSFAGMRNARTEIFWNGVLLNALIEILSKANLRFRVYAGIGNEWGDNGVNLGFVKIKDINDAIDPILLPYYQLMQEATVIMGLNGIWRDGWESKLDKSITSSFWRVVSNETTLKNALIETLVTTNDFGSSRDDTANPKTKILVPPVTNINEAKDAILSVIKQIEGVSNRNNTMTEIQKIKIEEKRREYELNKNEYLSFGSERYTSFKVLKSKDASDTSITIVSTLIESITEENIPFNKQVFYNILYDGSVLTFELGDAFKRNSFVCIKFNNNRMSRFLTFLKIDKEVQDKLPKILLR